MLQLVFCNIDQCFFFLVFLFRTLFVSLFDTLLKNTNRKQYNMFTIPIVLINHGKPRIFTNLPPKIGPKIIKVQYT